MTRTGNVEQPVRGWSDWQPLTDSSIASPPGRFLQWKAVLHAGGVLGSVGVNYLPVNSAPVVDDLVVVPGARINPQANFSQNQNVNITFPSSGQNSGITFDANSSSQPLQATKDRTAVTVRWAAHDDDGDTLVYSLFLRGDGDTAWWPLKKKIKELAYSFDATMIPDGGYRIKVVASDAPLAARKADAHNRGENQRSGFVIDTTPPVVSAISAELAPVESPCAPSGPCSAALVVNFDADDAASPIAHAEYSLDAGPWQHVDPVDKISDSKHEHYSFSFGITEENGKPAEHLITVRVFDRYDNVGLGKTVFPVSDKSGEKSSSMRFELFIAARYLKAKQRQAVVGVVTAISVAGVTAAGLPPSAISPARKSSSMRFELFIAARYLKAKRRQAVVGVVTVISGCRSHRGGCRADHCPRHHQRHAHTICRTS